MNNIPSYSLSTAWNYRRHKTAASMLKEIKALGFECVELNFALTKKQVEDFIRLKESGFVIVSSTHNFCPLPDGVDPRHASPEYYPLSSTDGYIRSLAVKFTKKSMDYAKKLNAGALIIHLGRVDMKDSTLRLFTTSDPRRFSEKRKKVLDERKELVTPFMKNAILSLEELLDYAQKIDLKIALENRYYIKELPSLEEFKAIFERFSDDKNLFYWHDVGHAQIYENLGILRHEDYLKSFSNRLIGVHLHDIILFDDHRAPGSGEFDFKRIKPFLKQDTICVIEAHRKSTLEEVRNSVKFLQDIL